MTTTFAMAPMTRDRSAPDGTPTAMNVEYYRQRASTAVILTEGTQPSADGQGYLLTPGIYTDDHVAGWARVADAVHTEGGRLIVRLMHVGRISHPDNTPHHRQPVAPSAVAPSIAMFTAAGMQPIPQPRALSTDEVAATSRTTATPRPARFAPAPTTSKSTEPTAIWSTSSCPATPTSAPTRIRCSPRLRTIKISDDLTSGRVPASAAFRRAPASAAEPRCATATPPKRRVRLEAIAFHRRAASRAG